MNHSLVAAIQASFEQAACAEDAAAVQRYMKTAQPFYGIKTPHRRQLIPAALREHPLKSAADRDQVIVALWAGRFRDEQYAALDIAQSQRRFRGPDDWPLLEEMLRTAPWWDTVDWIAATLMGPLLLEEASHRKAVAKWVNDPSVWMRRAALLVHLKHKHQTDVDALAATIEALQSDGEFWIRKAIGWVLREYSLSDPDWVVAFVEDHPELSALSKREALRRIH